MLEFSGLTLADAPRLKPLLTHTYSRICDYVFGTLFFWRDMWPAEYAIHDNTVFIRLELEPGGQKGYMLPVGGDLKESLYLLDTYFETQQTGAQENKNILYCNIPDKETKTLEQHYGNITITPVKSGGDYIYCAESMATLSGRKLHGQRNHSNYFERTWEHHFEEISKSNVQDVKAFIESKAVSSPTELFQEGNRKTFEALDNLDTYGFSSLALYADKALIGFTLGTLLDDTLYVTIEQADREYRGAYPKLASTFVSKHLHAGATHVNREDDLGNEGLRKAKLAWNPLEIIGRNTVMVSDINF